MILKAVPTGQVYKQLLTSLPGIPFKRDSITGNQHIKGRVRKRESRARQIIGSVSIPASPKSCPVRTSEGEVAVGPGG